MPTKAAMRVAWMMYRWFNLRRDGYEGLLAERLDEALNLPKVIDKLEDIRTTTIDPAIEALATEALRLLEGEG